MKVNNKINKNYDLLSLKLIKSKTYQKKHFLKNIMLKDIEYRLKKILHIIYLFHLKRKKILFVGTPLNMHKEIKKKKFLKKRRLFFIPHKAWIAGTITNQKKYLKSILRKKIDLVVILDKELNISVLEESYKSKLVVISLNSDLNPFDTMSSYKVPGNLILPKNKLKNNFFFSVLFALIKRTRRPTKNKLIVYSRKESLASKLKKRKFRKKIYKKKWFKKKSKKKQKHR